MPTNFICGRKSNSNYTNVENVPLNIKIFQHLVIESLEFIFTEKKAEKNSFKKKCIAWGFLGF